MDSTPIPSGFYPAASQIWSALHGAPAAEPVPEAQLTYGQLLQADARWLDLPPRLRRRKRLSWRLACESVMHISSVGNLHMQTAPPDINETTSCNAHKPRVGRGEGGDA